MTFSINTEKPYLLGLDLMTESPLPILKSFSAVLKENFWVLLACVFAIIISFFFYLLSKRKKAEEIIEIMESAVELKVPNKVDYEKGNIVKLDILVNGQTIDSFSSILAKQNAEFVGRNRVKKLSELIPRQQFDIPIQAAIGSRIIARETIKALRKDVTAKLYGGDVTRKRKLLEKQKEGKKKMRQIGKVAVPKEAFKEFLKQ